MGVENVLVSATAHKWRLERSCQSHFFSSTIWSFYLMHVNSLLQHGGARVISVTREANQLGLCPRPWRGRVGEKEGAGKGGRKLCRTLKDLPEASAAIV